MSLRQTPRRKTTNNRPGLLFRAEGIKMLEIDGIRYLEKPESVSYDEIHEVLYAAHAVNRAKGMNMHNAELSGEELKESIEGKNGKCYVAMDGDRVVGTTSYELRSRNRWYAKGTIPYLTKAGVLPEYNGKGVYKTLAKYRDEEVAKLDCSVSEFDTAEHNDRIQEIWAKKGARKVSFIAPKDADHYSVVIAYWPKGCPYSKLYCALRFTLKKWYVKLRYRVGGQKRF